LLVDSIGVEPLSKFAKSTQASEDDTLQFHTDLTSVFVVLVSLFMQCMHCSDMCESLHSNRELLRDLGKLVATRRDSKAKTKRLYAVYDTA
jgi:hypothetical protein